VIILLCVRWYLRYSLTHRDLEEIMAERNLSINQVTIWRWVQRYAPILNQRIRREPRHPNRSWRVDETYVRVAGSWAYLYRAVDSAGETIEFMLSPKRDLIAAKLFLQLALSHRRPRPRVINVDGHPAYASAVAELKQTGERGTGLLILADTGGSNGYRTHAWKTELPSQLANAFGLAVTVAHYPTGASKWNPIEHRLFSAISLHGAAEPLYSHQKILNFARTTKTGLAVTAYLDRRNYLVGLKPFPGRDRRPMPSKTRGPPPLELVHHVSNVKLFLRGRLVRLICKFLR
jgi:transposase-like protein